MYHATGNLWPPILSHFLVNLVGFLRLRTLHRAAQIAASPQVIPVRDEP
jgi:membrane protease YdiL (CAAX protease family)